MKTDLAKRIAKGEEPFITMATGCSDDCFGDLVSIGYAEKTYQTDRRGEVISFSWTYLGPGLIQTIDGPMRRGDSTSG